jgi:hypothetical protein
MAAKILPDRELVCQLLDYDPTTGSLTWKSRPREMFRREVDWLGWNVKYAGRTAGRVQVRGSVSVNLGGAKFLAHRLVWLIAYGEPVPDQLDHRDMDPTNNRLDNLRPATDVQNQANRRAHRDSATGVKGVRRSGTPGKFDVWIYRGKPIYLGTYSSIEDAAEAYRKAAIRLHGEFARWV